MGRAQFSSASLVDLDPQEVEAEDNDLTQRLERIPDLSRQLRDAPREVKRQLFDAFELRITYDRAERRIEVSATVSEAIAQAFENGKALREGGLQVTVCDIAGAGFEPATFGL